MAKVMIVTGGSRGIGAEIVRKAAASGYAVAINYGRSKDRAEALVREIAGKGGRAIAIQADIAKEADIERLFVEADRHLGGLGVLVNNAGVSVSTTIADCKAADYETIFGINVRGLILCSRAAVRAMSTRRGGRGGVIVNISSISPVYGGLPQDVLYAASKGAVDAFTLGLAKEVAGEGIRVCGVRPGLTETEMLDADFGPGKAAEAAKQSVPLGRIGQPHEIASAVLYLASEAADYITGSFINVSGGREINVKMAAG
jgi:NAD(P)-dependent dehydrogenase (short-subunit alcohol dehydrogenase family)